MPRSPEAPNLGLKIAADLERIKSGQRPQAPHDNLGRIPRTWIVRVWNRWLKHKQYDPLDLRPGESRHTNSVAPPSTTDQFSPKLDRGDGFK